jgi:hypothetical protein
MNDGNCLLSTRGSVRTGNSESNGRAWVRRADTEKERTKTLRDNAEDWVIALAMRAMEKRGEEASDESDETGKHL